MQDTRRPLIAGNWKMNGLSVASSELAAMVQGAETIAPQVDLLLCPPATLIVAFAARAKGSRIMIGGQDCHVAASGAHTGDISAEMLRDSGAQYVLVGHSERRADHHESDELVCRKALAARRAGLVAIVCVGETQTEREEGRTLEVIGRQLAGSVPEGATAADLVVAYEPVWAIGSGRTPTPEDVEQVHTFIRKKLMERLTDGSRIRILYGGSVKPSNAAELMAAPDVDGVLVGGASLKAADFLGIAAAVPK